jgi:hypothetical protein
MLGYASNSRFRILYREMEHFRELLATSFFSIAKKTKQKRLGNPNLSAVRLSQAGSSVKQQDFQASATNSNVFSF